MASMNKKSGKGRRAASIWYGLTGIVEDGCTDRVEKERRGGQAGTEQRHDPGDEIGTKVAGMRRTWKFETDTSK